MAQSDLTKDQIKTETEKWSGHLRTVVFYLSDKFVAVFCLSLSSVAGDLDSSNCNLQVTENKNFLLEFASYV